MHSRVVLPPHSGHEYPEMYLGTERRRGKTCRSLRPVSSCCRRRLEPAEDGGWICTGCGEDDAQWR